MRPVRWSYREEQALFDYVKTHIIGPNEICWKDAPLYFKNRTLAEITSKFNRMKREECHFWDVDDENCVQMVEETHTHQPCAIPLLPLTEQISSLDEKHDADKPLRFEIDENKNYSDVPGTVVKAWSELL